MRVYCVMQSISITLVTTPSNRRFLCSTGGGNKVMITVLMLIGLPFLGLIALWLLGELIHELDKYNR